MTHFITMDNLQARSINYFPVGTSNNLKKAIVGEKSSMIFISLKVWTEKSYKIKTVYCKTF